MKRLRPFAPLAALFAVLGCSNADGSLLIVDDGARAIWRVTPAP